MALFIVVLLNINSYAAVSANDGSAFVTKAEFDALVNTFNEQMDTYQSGLNAKIDGAISNYLAGLSSVTQSKVSILTPNWSRVTAVNGVEDPTFTIPNLNILLAGGIKGYFSWSSASSDQKNYTLRFSSRYTYSNNNNNKRALVTCSKSEANQTASDVKFYWAGVTNQYKESWAINGSFNETATTDLYGVESQSGTKSFKLQNGININLSDGYQGSLETLASITTPIISYVFAGSNTNTLTFSNKSVSTVCTIDAGTPDSLFEHIIQYAGAASWCLSVPTFTKTFRTHSSSSITSNIMSSVSKDATGSVTCFAGPMTDPSQGSSTNTSFTHETKDAKKYPSIGMLKSNRSASAIYQTADSIPYEYKTTKGELKDVKLNVGFPLLAAPKDAEIKWSPRFTTCKAWDATNKKWIDGTATRVKLLFSVGEFSDKIASTNLIAADSPLGKTTDGGVLCNICKVSSDQATEVTFKMPKDGIVYAKWVPNTSNYTTTNWTQPIDLTQSNTYTQLIDNYIYK